MLESNGLVAAPLAAASGGVTPGWEWVQVVDLDTDEIVIDATMVDCDAGICWRWIYGRAHPFLGSYKIMCVPEVLKFFQEQWKPLL